MKKKKEIDSGNDLGDAFIREIDEELKNEKLQRLWDKYGLFIILFVVAAVSAAVSFETFKSWNEKRNQEFSNAYAYALNLQNQGRYAEAADILQNLEKAKRGVYSDIAQIQLANIKLEQGETEAAIALLENASANSSFNPQMREVATIKLASLKLDYAQAEEIQNLLSQFVNKPGTWTNTAKELLAMLAIRESDFETARNLYQELSSAENGSESSRARAADMLNVLEDSQEKN